MKNRNSFTGKIGFVLAAAGSAVGLGNIWRFPYLAAKYGGGIFLLVYLILALTFGFALMCAEIALGRKTGQSAIGAFGSLNKKYKFIGVMAAIVPIIILPYYSVIGGWVTKYLAVYITGGAKAAAADGYFESFIANPMEPIGWFLLFIGLTALVALFDVEKGVAYDEHRLPEYTEIAKSANELLRSAMYGFTDLYHSPNTQKLFDATSFGGLNAKDMADLTTGESLWSMDQKSDEAWDIQSKEAKNIAEKWMKEDKPHEKMISEMKLLIKSNEEGIISRKEMIDKLTAAEWLLENDDKMMIEDPYDPYNKIPNWGNRYWKALIETRESLGIDKHTSMRDMIQADYAASAKAVGNANYNKTQMQLYVVDRDMRALFDSMEIQKEQFATQSAAVTLTEPQTDKNAEEIEMTGVRVPHPVPELDERTIMQNQPKNYDFVIEPQTELNLTAQNQAQAK